MTGTSFPQLSERYRLIRELGQGGMANVYLAEDIRHHREVAVKVIRPELRQAISADRFLQEIELTARLQHPHILPLFDSGEAEGGLLFYVMPLVEGESLRDRLTRTGRLSIEEALSIARDVAAALTWAHQHGVVHRDIKPENILLAGDQALVADFGIALAVSGVDKTRMTAAGISVGTPAYMSPEQIVGEMNVDGRSDEYSLACVLFEMLTGEPPIVADNYQALAAKAIVEPPRHARALRAEVPANADAAIMKALAKQPADRFATPREFIDACTPAPARRASPIVLAVAGVVAAVALGVIWSLWSSSQKSRARASLVEVDRLAQGGRFAEGFTLARQAQARLGNDSAAMASLDGVSDLLTINTQPAGAAVYLQLTPDDGGAADSVRIGTTPVTAHRVARANYRVSVHLDGFMPAERMVSGGFTRARGTPIEVAVPLIKAGTVPADMVYVPGGEYQIVSPALPIGLKTTLEPYALDRYEVTNDQFAEFVRGGGYATARLWPRGATPAQYTDRTGLAGPRQWKNQEPTAGQGNHPVTGVSWYEASAFCASRGKRLPSLYEWEKAARNGQTSGMGIIMPWGYVYASGTTAEHRANFSSNGTVPVNAHPFGISAFGAYAMAGNVKEWLANPVGDGHALIGGSWQDPAYVYGEVGALPGTTATETIGFRCARNADSSQGGGDQGAGPITVATVAKVYKPVDDATFRSLLAFYRYDPKPPRPRVTDVTETPDWRRERIWFDGAGSDSILAYLYLPKSAQPPFQTLVLVPSNATFFAQKVSTAVEVDLAPHIKAGRAVLAVVFDGMIERQVMPGRITTPPPSVAFRDLMVRHATELRMGMDMLATRPEIDTTRLAYFGISWGAGSRLVFAGIDQRFKAAVLIGAGIDERVQPTLPEAANFNFVPRIRVPKLMVNGRQDEEHPWNTRALPLWNLLREPKELKLYDGVGHRPPVEMRAQSINEFLDRVMGAVNKAQR
jgi:formylglycine-generating enzyme required for sulfatase activity/tRNA A-37 threonylcarbamoyl transferase component Bud32/dienelactone hydrolase